MALAELLILQSKTTSFRVYLFLIRELFSYFLKLCPQSNCHNDFLKARFVCLPLSPLSLCMYVYPCIQIIFVYWSTHNSHFIVKTIINRLGCNKSCMSRQNFSTTCLGTFCKDKRNQVYWSNNNRHSWKQSWLLHPVKETWVLKGLMTSLKQRLPSVRDFYDLLEPGAL